MVDPAGLAAAHRVSAAVRHGARARARNCLVARARARNCLMARARVRNCPDGAGGRGRAGAGDQRACGGAIRSSQLATRGSAVQRSGDSPQSNRPITADFLVSGLLTRPIRVNRPVNM